MKLRQALLVAAIAGICAISTPTQESRAEAACFYPRVRVTQYWETQTCPGSPVCNHVEVLVGESGTDCDGTPWSWGNTTAPTRTYYWEQCPPICE